MNDKITNIIRRLSNKDIKEIKIAVKSNYISYPRLSTDGRILPSQWKSWQVLQKFSIGFISGDCESGEFKLSEFGKELAGKLK